MPIPETILAGTGRVTTTSMTDSSIHYHASDYTALRHRLSTDGYLLIRRVIPAPHILKARSLIISDMLASGFISDSLKSDAAMSESPWPDNKKGPSLLSRYDLMQDESMMNVLESDAVRELMEELIVLVGVDGSNDEAVDGCLEECTIEAGVECLPYKWLRAVGTGLFTGPHLDRVYLPKNPHLLTCWIPIGACSTALGSIVVAHASHTSPQFSRLRSEYGLRLLGKDGTASGWINEDPNQIEAMFETGMIDWRSCEFGFGDVCIFGIDLLHVSATNVEEEWRLSCDTRWYHKGHPYPPY